MRVSLTKGHDIRIAGTPRREIVAIGSSESVCIQPIEFRGVKPKLTVKEGDSVKVGSPLFFDKIKPDVRWASPGGGTVSEIRFGPRRVIERIVIKLDDSENAEEHKAYRSSELDSLGLDKVKQSLLNGGLWPLIRQRPFNKVADPNDVPRAIFVSGFNLAPLTVDLDLALSWQTGPFQAGLTVLNQLTQGSVHLSVHADTVGETLSGSANVEQHVFSGPHPSGNVGIQIHHIDPLNPGEVVWTVLAQHVVTLGTFFLTGNFDPFLIGSIGGPGVSDPVHFKGRMGMSLEPILKGRLGEGHSRIISGDVLTGKESGEDGYIGYYDSSVSVVPDSDDREFLGLLKPGNKDSRYSLSRAFLGIGNGAFNFSTQLGGSLRPMVPIDAWERVLPMNIFPNALYRAVLAQDFEEMEGLGILECDEEDFALCSFACPSKIDVGAVIRQGLDLMEQEG